MSLLTPSRPTLGAHTHSAATMVPDASRAERRTSYAVSDFPTPHGREEEWRFTPVDRLGDLFRDAPAPTHLTLHEWLPGGVTSRTVSVPAWVATNPPQPADRAAAAAAAHNGGVHLIDIPAECELADPVRVTLHGEGGLAHGHLAVRVGHHAKATVVLAHTGRAAYGQVVTVLSGESADLTVVTVQEWDDDTQHLAQHDVVVGRDATVRHVAVTLGGGIVRLSTNVSYAAPGGTFEGLGVYFADAGQHLEHRLFIDHAVPNCRSTVEYKGALQGSTARTVWVGDVLIRAAAQGTDTYELNRNLLLTPGARADSVPNLEIETGEIVGAGHASATGRFDDEQLFYLQARGIPEDEARRLVVRGFFASLLQRIDIADIEEHLMEAIEHELARSAS